MRAIASLNLAMVFCLLLTGCPKMDDPNGAPDAPADKKKPIKRDSTGDLTGVDWFTFLAGSVYCAEEPSMGEHGGETRYEFFDDNTLAAIPYLLNKKGERQVLYSSEVQGRWDVQEDILVLVAGQEEMRLDMEMASGEGFVFSGLENENHIVKFYACP